MQGDAARRNASSVLEVSTADACSTQFIKELHMPIVSYTHCDDLSIARQVTGWRTLMCGSEVGGVHFCTLTTMCCPLISCTQACQHLSPKQQRCSLHAVLQTDKVISRVAVQPTAEPGYIIKVSSVSRVSAFTWYRHTVSAQNLRLQKS